MPRKGRGSKGMESPQELLKRIRVPEPNPEYGEIELRILVEQLLRSGHTFGQTAEAVKKLTGQVIAEDKNGNIRWLHGNKRRKVSQTIARSSGPRMSAPVAQLGSSARLKPERALVQFQPGAPKRRSADAIVAIMYGMNADEADRLHPPGADAIELHPQVVEVDSTRMRIGKGWEGKGSFHETKSTKVARRVKDQHRRKEGAREAEEADICSSEPARVLSPPPGLCETGGLERYDSSGMASGEAPHEEGADQEGEVFHEIGKTLKQLGAVVGAWAGGYGS